MRWKLLLISSLLASLAGASASLGLAHLLGFDLSAELLSASLPALASLLFPLATIIFASIFVYRHTARRRPLQAIVTALFSLLLAVAAFSLLPLLL